MRLTGLQAEAERVADEPFHLTMCIDPEGNEFMMTRRRG